MRTRLLASSGTPDQVSGGEMSAPSQVYCAGISPPGGIAGLVMTKGMIISSALPSRGHATGPPLPPGRRDELRSRANPSLRARRLAARGSALHRHLRSRDTGFVGDLLDAARICPGLRVPDLA